MAGALTSLSVDPSLLDKMKRYYGKNAASNSGLFSGTVAKTTPGNRHGFIDSGLFCHYCRDLFERNFQSGYAGQANPGFADSYGRHAAHGGRPAPIEELRIDIADLEAKLAALTANSVMRQRAENLGYHPATAENIVYIEVEGYVSRQTAVLANPLPAQPQNTQIILADAYRQSLIDWIQEEWVRLSHLIKEVQP